MRANKHKATALRINTDGTTAIVKAKNGRDFSLEELQSFVGGYIEIIQLDDEYIMVVNEEGKLIGLPTNENATCMLAEIFGMVNYIVGDVIICKSKFVK